MSVPNHRFDDYISGLGVITPFTVPQPPHVFFGGPVSGPDALPSFRAIDISDLPAGIGSVTSVASADGSIFVTNPTTAVDLSVVKAPKLTTPRAINGVNFDGTAPITITVPVSTGVTGLGSGIASFLATPSSANLLSAMADKTGTGLLVFGTSPTLITAVLGSSTATTQAPGDSSTKVATTAYADAAAAQSGSFGACVYASTTALPASTYANGTAGVGATLTANANGSLSLDGSSPAVNDRVLIKNQASTLQNGPFIVTATGSAGAVFVLTRTTDADQSVEIRTGKTVFVTGGSTLGSTTWSVNSANSPTIGTDPITFSQSGGPGSVVGGNGITVTGASVAIDTSVTVDKTTAQALTHKDLTDATNTFPTFNQNTTGSAAKWTTARLLAGNSVDGSANVAFSNAFIVQGTADSGLSGAQFLGALATGIVKNTTTTGVLSIAVAGDFPTLNQSTTGNAATATALQTARTIGGNSFNGTANITVATATAGFTVSGGDLSVGANNIAVTGSIGSTGSRVLKGWFIDLQVTNAIVGSVTGSAATATTATTATNLAGGAGGSIPYQSAAGTTAMLANGSSGQVLQSNGGTAAPSWIALSAGTVSSIASADGSITVVNPTSAADLAVVKAPRWSNARNLAGNSVDGSANVAFANKFIVQGTSDAGLSAAQFLGNLGTGIIKNATTSGVLSIAVAGDFPTLNQNTTGSAATLTTARNIYGNSFNGSADVTGLIIATYGGTNNAFFQVSGPATSIKTFSFPNASATVLTDNAAVTAAQGGTGQVSYTIGDILQASGTTTLSKLAAVATGNVLISGGVATVSSWGKVGLTTHVTGILPPANGGTGTTALTPGSIPFITTGGVLAEDNNRLFFDGVNFYVGMGTRTPARRLELFDAASDYQMRLGKGGATSYDVGRKDSTGLLNFFGNQTGFVGYVFTGIDGEQGRFTSAGLTASLANSTGLPFPSGVTLATQAANAVFAGPTSGGAAAPTFRPLVTADIPSLSGSYVSLTNTVWLALNQDVYLDSWGTLANALSHNAGQIRLIVTSQYSVASSDSTPTRCVVAFRGTGSFTVASGQTLTINSLEPPPATQVFFGLGNVILGKNAVPSMNASWWAGITGTSDDNHAFNQITTSLTNNTGGLVDIGTGVWKLFNWAPPSGTVVRGSGQGLNAANATVLTLSDTSTAGAVVNVSQSAFYGIKFQNLTISTGGATASSCLIARGSNPNTSTVFECNGVTFHGTGVGATVSTGTPQVYIKDNSGAWELNSATFFHCSWWTPANSRSVFCDTPNTSLYITNPFIFIGQGTTFLKASQIGNVKIVAPTVDGSDSSAPTVTLDRNVTASLSGATLSVSSGTLTVSDIGRQIVIGGFTTYIVGLLTSQSATTLNSSSIGSTTCSIYRAVPSTTRAQAFCWFTGGRGNVHIDNSRDEGLRYFLIVDGGGVSGQPYYPIKITNSAIQSFIQLNVSATIQSTANDYFSNTYSDAAGVTAQIVSVGDRVAQGSLAGITTLSARASGINLIVPQLWKDHDGSSVFVTELNSLEGSTRFQAMNTPLQIKHGAEFATNPESTKSVLAVGSCATSGDTKPQIMWGECDQYTNLFTNVYWTYRDHATGWCNFKGSQAGFVQYEFDAPCNDTRVPVTTAAATVAPAASASGTVYICTNANPTFNLPASAGCTVGKTRFFVKAVGGNLSVVPNGSDVIDGTQWDATNKTFSGYHANSAITNYILRYQMAEFIYTEVPAWTLVGAFIYKI